MRLLRATITPSSNFATRLKGDTIFGHICWAVRFGFGQERLGDLLANYDGTPFLIASDAFPSGFLPKPSLPMNFFIPPNDKNSDKKSIRKKIWLTMDNLISGNFGAALTKEAMFKALAKENDEFKEFRNNISRQNTKFDALGESVTMHNSISRLTGTTGEDFAPFSRAEFALRGVPHDIYFLIDETQFSEAELQSTLQMLANMGFGADTSIGKGRFSVDKICEICATKSKNFETSNAVMTLSPSILAGVNLDENAGEQAFYTTFTRFGKIGFDAPNPFKNPILFADTGAVITRKFDANKPYIGKSVRNIAPNRDHIVQQGYAIVLPTCIKEKNEKV